MTTQQNLKQASIATETLIIKESAELLFEAGGKNFLSKASQETIQKATIEGAESALTAGSKALIKDSAKAAGKAGTKAVGKEVSKEMSKEVSKTVAKTAGREILKSAGRAAGVGAAIDAGFGAIKGVKKYQKGEWTGKEASIHVVKEAGTGAAASAVGVGGVALLVAVTGPISIPAMLAVSISFSVATKIGLTSLFS